MLILEHIRTAVESLKRTRSRTILTVTGVAIGVASVTTIFALGGGVTTMINRQINGVGNTLALVRPSAKQAGLIDLGNPTAQTAYTTSPITERDLEAIQQIKGVQAATPLMTLSGSVRSNDQRPKNVSVLATTPSFTATTPLKFDDGQFLDDVTLENTVVVGKQLALDLFGTDDAVGKNFLIRGQRFTVIGVLGRQNNPINYDNIDLDHAAIISLDSGKLFNQGVAQIQQIDVKAKPGTNMTNLQKDISSSIKESHDSETDTSVLIGEQIAQPTNKLFSLISGVIALIAGISLLVGGIGIMNIMLVSVAERTREIGLRKAVGATNSSIVSQFMIESIIISLLGGVIGYFAGYVLAFIVSLMLPYDPSLSWSVAAYAALLSIGIGVLFGLYPAIRAARKNPIESLRRLH